MMKILILFDQESRNHNGTDFYEHLRESSALADHDVDSVLLSSDEIHYCTGCFGCWIKTPGLCVNLQDEANSIAARYISADAALALSRITYGGFSADVKVFLDRNIPSVLPFFQTINGEMHHQKRFGQYPSWVAIGYGDFTENEQQTFLELAQRNALNFHAPKHLALTARDMDEFSGALNELATFLKEAVR